MEPILDDSSLVASSTLSPVTRVRSLVGAIAALRKLGARPVLRTVRDAADQDLGNGRTLRAVLFDKTITAKDEARFVASLLQKPPHIDGKDGLFAEKEGRRAIEARAMGRPVMGLGFAALTHRVVVALATDDRPTGAAIKVEITYVDEDGCRDEQVEVRAFVTGDEVRSAEFTLRDEIISSVSNGREIVERLSGLFPRLRLGPDAESSIREMTGNETVFPLLKRHLRALNDAALTWSGGAYEPQGVTSSVESKPTLTHGTYGPMRDFQMPIGFDPLRFSLHTKLFVGNKRIYYSPIQVEGQGLVVVGYYGDHLPTVKYPTL